MTPEPCLLWSIPHGASAGNILRTGVLATVLDTRRDLRVVLVSPLSADPAFTREFAHPRVSFEILPAHAPGGFEGRLLGIIQARYLQICKTDTLRIRGPKEFPGATRLRTLKRLLARVVAPDGPRAAGTTCRIGWFPIRRWKRCSIVIALRWPPPRRPA